ncbi:hypothetical protein [Synechococcus sp. R6-5]|uniref:hypothetical protein n=1 Tax=Synechococcus sp. R6-5 TaxID=2421326 RepID=UPI0039C04088
MVLDTLPLVAAVAIAIFLLFFWVRVIRDAVWTTVGVLIILAVLFVVFNIGPRQVLQELRDPFTFVERVWQVIVGWFKALFP